MGRSVWLEIDGRRVEAKEGRLLIEAAKEAGIDIPTLCYSNRLPPYGGCRICSVEIESGEKSRVVVSCAYPVEEGLKVKTRSCKIDKIRKIIVELGAPLVAKEGLLKGKFRRLAEEYGADVHRFVSKSVAEPTGCTLCGLCMGMCSEEVVGANAIGFVGRGIEREIVFFPTTHCNYRTCKKCFPVCPTGKIANEAGDCIFPGSSIYDYLAKHGVKVHTLRAMVDAGEKQGCISASHENGGEP